MGGAQRADFLDDEEPTSPWVPTPAIDETELECVHGNEPAEPAFPGMDPLTKAEESAAKVRAAIARDRGRR